MLAALLLACAAAGHPNSISRSRIEVDGARARVELAVQALTLIEEQGGDADGDLLLDDGELAAARPGIETYVLDHLALYTGGVPETGGRRAAGAVTGLRAELDPPSGGQFPMLGQWVFLELAYQAAEPFQDLAVRFELFEVMNSLHLDYATLVWNGEEPQTFVFALGSRTWEHEPWSRRRPRVLRAFLARGARDAACGPDAPLLLAALLCASPRRRAALWAALLSVLGFALGLPAGALAHLPLPAGFAPLAAALSAAYVATDALLRRAPRVPWLEAGAFGLVVGLAAGQAAAGDVRDEPLSRAAALGLELGAAPAVLLIALLAYALLAALPGDRTAAGAEPWLAPKSVRRAALLLTAAAGFALFAARAGFLDWLA